MFEICSGCAADESFSFIVHFPFLKQNACKFKFAFGIPCEISGMVATCEAYALQCLDSLSFGFLTFLCSRLVMSLLASPGFLVSLSQGAVIGIDDEDDSTFTVTVDQKTFHFQGESRAIFTCI